MVQSVRRCCGDGARCHHRAARAQAVARAGATGISTFLAR
jgi:hypothetical protein